MIQLEHDFAKHSGTSFPGGGCGNTWAKFIEYFTGHSLLHYMLGSAVNSVQWSRQIATGCSLTSTLGLTKEKQSATQLAH